MAIMRKKILSILALFCLTVTGAWADDDSGSCGTSVTYSYEESTHTLTISGRNIAMQQMAQAAHDLVERQPDADDTTQKETNKHHNHKKDKSCEEKNV